MKTKEQLRAEVLAKRQMALPNKRIEVKSQSIALDEFLLSLGAYEDVKDKDLWLAYELAHPDRKVLFYKVTNNFVEIFYRERQNLEA